jgi:hypothetical protein
LLDAPDAALVMSTVNALAAKTDAADDRPIEARRADAFVAMFTGAPSVSGLPQAHRSPAQIQVTVPATTLLGLTDTPGELAGYGPITAEVARRIAAHGTWRRLLTDPVSGSCSTRPADLRPPHNWPRSSSPAIGPAASPAATNPPGDATSTTANPGEPAALPARTTSARSAGGTIAPRTPALDPDPPPRRIHHLDQLHRQAL